MSIRTFTVHICALISTTATCYALSPLQSQDVPIAQMEIGFPSDGIASELENQSLLSALDLSDNQRIQVATFVGQFKHLSRAHFDSYASLPAEEREMKAKEYAAQQTHFWNKNLTRILSSQQLRRLRQRELQIRGMFAWLENEPRTVLKLTDAQVILIKKKKEELLALFMKDDGSKDFRKQCVDTQRMVERTIIESFEPEQRSRFYEMMGPPFKGP